MFASAVAEPVRCVEGCGGGDPSTLGILGFVIALLSLGAAFKAWKISDASLEIANAQHQEFLKQLRARADFKLELHLEGHPGPVVETTADEVTLRWRMTIENSGDKAATDVGVNLLIPADLRNLRSDEKTGTTPPTTIERLQASDGSDYPAQYLAELVSRFSLRMARITYASATVKTPTTPGQERLVPAVFRVWSPDMPDEVEFRSVKSEVRIRRTG